MGLIIDATPHRLLRAGFRFVLALWACGHAAGARAQILDDLDFRREGADAVLVIRFVTPVQYQRATLARTGDQALVFYRVLPTRQPTGSGGAERRLPARAAADGAGGLPGVTVTDETTREGSDERRLLVRLSTATPYRVRAGRGGRSVELVLLGRGPVLATPVPAAELPPDIVGRYRVTLETASEAGTYLSAPIPSSLQDANVYTTRRVEAGKTVHATHLGPFATRAEAEAAWAALRGRFPRAAVTLADEPQATVQAAATAASAPAELAVAPLAEGELDRRAATLLSAAREALARGDAAAAIETLSTLLDLPPNASARAAQALIAQARHQAGDPGRARAEYEAFLRLYPNGDDAERARAALLALSPGEPLPGAPRKTTATTTLTGSVSSTYYGGQSKVRTQEFQDSPLNGLPQLVSDATLAAADQKQIVSTVDVNWRDRDADADRRFVVRDAYTQDQLRPDKTRNRLSALYYDHRSFAMGTSLRLGRQSPLGGGVLGRFDGVQAGYTFKPRWKLGAVAGVPTDTLLDTRRRFWGASIEAEALTPQFGASLYTMQQTVDGQTDRRAVGSEMRYFDAGLSGTAQLDYDVLLKGLNIASLQGTWQRPDNTVFNLLLDRRTTPMLMLGNTLFFTDPNLPLRPTRIGDLLQTTPLQQLRERARAMAAPSTQAGLGLTTPVSPQWQLGADLRYASTGAVAPVPDILPDGLPASGGIWSVGLQAIATNLYSGRDTHVFIVNRVRGPTFQGQLVSYNNASALGAGWQLEPSLKYYHQSDNTGTRSTRWSPGLRWSWRFVPEAVLESEFNTERSRTTGLTRDETSTRTYFYVGGRYDF